MENPQPTQSLFRRIVRWVPPVFLAAMHVAAWGTLFLGGMAGVTAWVLLLSVVPLLGAAALLATGVYALWKRRRSIPVAATIGMSLLALYPGAWNFGVWNFAYPASIEDTRPHASVRLPSDETLRVCWGGDRLETNQHAFTPDQRWAYDLVVEPAFHGSANLEDYGCFGTPVVAPAGAKVHAAHDGEPDVPPGVPSNPLKPLGNFVALELETKTFLLIAHLQKGSIAVKAGDHVEEGQEIGRCGNSGNTSEPHIHIHHQRQDPLLFPVNFAEGLPLFFHGHGGDPMPEGGVRIESDRAVPFGAVVRHEGTEAASQ
jgi:hypothetical protein